MNITRLRPLKSVSASPATAERPVSETKKVKVTPEASSLLAEVLASLHGIELPIVQFMPACLNGNGKHLSRQFAAAAVAFYGRTLLLDAGSNVITAERGLVSRAPSRKQRRSFPVMPDSDIPGLYHRQAFDVAFDLIATETPDTQPFRMMVIQSASPVANPSALERARHCHGSILTVAAGLTSLPDLHATTRQLRHAGGKLLGVVLFDVPIIRLPFSRRRAA